MSAMPVVLSAPFIIQPQVLSVARFIELIIYIIMCKDKAPMYKSSRSKAPKTANLLLQTCEKNQWLFWLRSIGVGFSSRNNFFNLDSFAKVSISVGFIVPNFR